MSASFDQRRYRELLDQFLNQTATAQDRDELESLVLSSPELRQHFVEHLHQESLLRLQDQSSRLPLEEIAGGKLSLTAASPASSDAPANYGQASQGMSTTWVSMAAASITALVFLGVGLAIRTIKTPGSFAIMGPTENCQWVSSNLPTNQGALLGEGRLILASGIATVQFNRVELKMEGPADVELINSSRCMVRSGRVYAEVYPGGEGFSVQTPTSLFVDRGTRFGVNVHASGDSDLTVVEGLVDATNSSVGESMAVRTKGRVRISATKIERMERLQDEGVQPSEETPTSVLNRPRQVQISTAVGNGRDAYVIRGKEQPETKHEGVILVKNPLEVDYAMMWRRHGLLQFDLSLLADAKIRKAKLQLQGVATNIGFLSLTPTTTFAIYGVTDESQENWTEESVTFKTAPGFRNQGIDVEPAKTMLLGKFEVRNDQTTKAFYVTGDALVDFLNSDTTGVATLIIVSENHGEGEAYAHGFAGRLHPELPPPTLRLVVTSGR